MKKHLYLIRHGQTLFNVRHRIQGWCDSPLTDLGKKQCLAAKEMLKDIEFDHYYSSTSERCCDSIELIIGDKSYVRHKGLRERYFGTFEGESEDLNPKWEGGYDDVFPHFGGETSQETRERVSNALEEIMVKEDHNCVLAMSSSGAMTNSALTWIKRERIEEEFVKGFPNCAVMHYVIDENGKWDLEEILRPLVK